MRVLFFLRHGGYVRNFESALTEMAERGHDVHCMLGGSRMRWLEGRTPPIVPLAARYENVTYETAPDGRHELSQAADGLRGVLDWLRYLRPEYANAPKLRARVEGRIPEPVRRALLSAGAATPEGNRNLRRVLSVVERALPWSPVLDEAISAQRPDVVCVTPLVDLGSSQVDVMRSARSLGIPAVLCVASWDNLTNKGLIRGDPDLVTVWNEFQREEAVVLHGQSPERVVATGAQSYDHWFSWPQKRTRTEFSARVGLEERRRYVLFLGSSPFVAPDEVPFVRSWVRALRQAADERVRDLAVLVRPHPQNGRQWQEADFDGLDGVAVWPRGGADPIDTASRADYYDSIRFCEAVVGINTSALIESAIVGRPVLTILDEHFVDTQEGTLHFEHLRRAGGGLLREAGSLPEHLEQLSAVLAGDDGFEERNRGFLRAFVRPQGLDRPAAPVLADALERAAEQGSQPSPPVPPALPAASTLLKAVAAGVRVTPGRKRRAKNRRRAERSAAHTKKSSPGATEPVLEAAR